MRLLNVHTLKLQDFIQEGIPDYYILSHRWGEDEVSYKDFYKGRVRTGAGYNKIIEFCTFIRTRFPNSQWVWIDTCKGNIMYAWYENARECYVYLKDVKEIPAQAKVDALPSSFASSEWFTRGWTLQELLAPRRVVFCNASWQVIGQKTSLNRFDTWLYCEVDLLPLISNITGIPDAFLKGTKSINQASIARRMGWAASRVTTRIEDEAYCLLGIFGINMPLIYGEGGRAFFRLQEEIIKRSADQSIFAWKLRHDLRSLKTILAKTPEDFPNLRVDVSDEPSLSWQPYTVTNSGIEITATLFSCDNEETFVGQNDGFENLPQVCHMALKYKRQGMPVFILLKKSRENVYKRALPSDFYRDSPSSGAVQLTGKRIYLDTGSEILDVRRNYHQPN